MIHFKLNQMPVKRSSNHRVQKIANGPHLIAQSDLMKLM